MINMTPEEARKFQDEWMASRPKWGDQDENGVDLSHLRANLKLTPDERVRKHDRILKVMMEVRRGAYNAGLRRDP